MTWDRLSVFAIAAAFLTWANLAPNTLFQDRYGRGFPLKWTYDPLYRPSHLDETDPYLLETSPESKWILDRTALAVDVVVALLAIGMSLAVNEVVQTSAGNRSPAIPPNDWPRERISSV